MEVLMRIPREIEIDLKKSKRLFLDKNQKLLNNDSIINVDFKLVDIGSTLKKTSKLFNNFSRKIYYVAILSLNELDRRGRQKEIVFYLSRIKKIKGSYKIYEINDFLLSKCYNDDKIICKRSRLFDFICFVRSKIISERKVHFEKLEVILILIVILFGLIVSIRHGHTIYELYRRLGFY